MQDFNLCKAGTMGAGERFYHDLKGKLIKYRFAVRAMKITAVLLLIGFLQVSAKAPAQEKITLKEKGASLMKVFTAIKKQTGYDFFFTSEILQEAKPIDINVKNASLKEVLDLCFRNQTLIYTISGRIITVSSKKNSVSYQQDDAPAEVVLKIQGRVLNENGEPVIASVTVKGTSKGTTTNDNGDFVLNDVEENATLIISGVGIESQEVKINGENNLQISVKVTVKILEEVVSKGYYSTSKRFSTGNVGKVNFQTIEKQPVSNPLAALQGRIPGLQITQNTGVPGGGFTVRIRGKNSIRINGNEPLYVIDGVPFTPTSLSSPSLSYSIIQQGSPLNSVNPSDIESIEVLKDADATAIYGSRGANGVILITTKKGKAGETKFDVNFYTGSGKVTRFMKLLNTEQYLKMRYEAFENDGASPGSINPDYDLLVWDTTRYTDWQKELFGKKANYTDLQGNLSGGNLNTQFAIAGNYHKETTVFPGKFADTKGSIHFNVSHASNNKRFKALLVANYTADNNNLFAYDLTSLIVALAPNTPPILDSTGKLNWANGTFSNPFANLQKSYKARAVNLVANTVFSYKVFKDLQVRTSLGYTKLQMKETQINPLSSFDPSWGYSSANVYTLFANNSIETWIFEPQLDYTPSLGEGELSVILGGTFQQDIKDGRTIQGTGFNNEALMESLAAASKITSVNESYSKYRYNGIYGRIGYQLQKKYLFNLTARRDGSSRFGPGKQFANFGAIGAAWIFSDESFIKNKLPFLSYGKLKASYGTTGSDQIGDYQYLGTWRPTTFTYQDNTGLRPTALANPDYGWETNKKLETGIEIGFFNDRILLNAYYYRNKSSNQLVGYPLAGTTGFSSVIGNLPATVLNTGLEFELTSTNVKSKAFSWVSSFNITFPKNKLIAFPGLETSTYANTYVVGEPLSIVKAFHFLGVDEGNGIYQFEDVDKDGSVSPVYPNDLTNYKRIEQSFYGGLENQIQFKRWTLDIFFQFAKQTGRNYTYFFLPPGFFFNQPTDVLDRWQKPGDNTNLQKFTQDYGQAFEAYFNNQMSDNSISDASFIRLKNLSVSYDLPDKWKEKVRLKSFRIFLQGQNLLTITNYLGMDPENQNLVLPPLSVLTVGFKCSL